MTRRTADDPTPTADAKPAISSGREDTDPDAAEEGDHEPARSPRSPRRRPRRPVPSTDGHAESADGRPDAAAPTGRTANDRSRDRFRTETRIIKAVGKVLASDGFNGLRINKVAREAGVDKVLIYRYFGGLDELIAAYAKELDFWPTADEVAGYDDAHIRGLPLPDRCATLICNLLRSIYRRPLTRDIIAWRLTQENELTRHLDQHRINVTHEVIERFITPDEMRDHPNLLPTIRVVANGALYLVVGERNNAVVAEEELTGHLDQDDGWTVLDRTVFDLMRCALG
jgi:AcrR family transcriptional regulator